jgi:hypothetical protein
MSLRRCLQNHPHLLEAAYDLTKRVFVGLGPVWSRLGYQRTERLILPLEEVTKKLVFDCRMCGQCILHSTGMTCSMTCPKNLRNGPCGGVRANGHCEVIPEIKCIWVEAYERSLHMPTYGEEIMLLQPPLDWQLQGTSAWVNMLTGADLKTPAGWETRVPGHGP